jgi:colanic acid/amylovoran biosynthesis glycosyltransferase
MRVGIHVRTFPIPSEAFVIEQARSLTRFKATVFARDMKSNAPEIDCRAIPASTKDWRKKVFALFPGLWGWGGASAFSGIDLLHAHFGPNGVYALPLARKLKVPLIVTFHGFDATVTPLSLFWSGGIMGKRYYLGLSRLQREATLVIAVSKFIEKRLLAMGFPREAVRQHYIGVDTSRFSPIEDHLRSQDIVCVGRLTAAKGIETLIRAFAGITSLYPESKLRLIGEGSDLQTFKQLTESLHLAHKVIFEGSMPHERVAAIVRTCAVSVLASKTGANGSQEAFGLASIEAAAAGIPSIVTRHGGLPETVVDGVTGIVVAEDSVSELANALSLVLASSELRTRMGSAGRELVLRKFNLSVQSRLLEDIYIEALNK